MTILVTGATGFVGQALVPVLLDAGFQVRALVRSAEQVATLPPAVDPAIVDLAAAAPWDALVDGCDAVVHLASAVRAVTPAIMQQVNHRATEQLALACRRRGVAHFLFTSTNLVYGFQRAMPCTERLRPEAWGDYPTSKLAGERALARVSLDARPEWIPLRATILRLASVYGAGSPHLKIYAERRSFDTMNQTRVHLIHLDDLIDGIVRCLEQDAPSGVYNLGDDGPLTVDRLCRLSGAPRRKNLDKILRLPEPALVMDTGLFKQAFGWQPRYPTVEHAIRVGDA